MASETPSPLDERGPQRRRPAVPLRPRGARARPRPWSAPRSWEQRAAKARAATAIKARRSRAGPPPSCSGRRRAPDPYPVLSRVLGSSSRRTVGRRDCFSRSLQVGSSDGAESRRAYSTVESDGPDVERSSDGGREGKRGKGARGGGREGRGEGRVEAAAGSDFEGRRGLRSGLHPRRRRAGRLRQSSRLHGRDEWSAVRAGRATTGRPAGAMATVRSSFCPCASSCSSPKCGDHGHAVDQPRVRGSMPHLGGRPSGRSGPWRPAPAPAITAPFR